MKWFNRKKKDLEMIKALRPTSKATRRLLEQMYDKMSDEEKRTFVLLTLQDKYHREIMEALERQQEQITRVADKTERQNWWVDFGSDVAANVFTDSLLAIGRKLFGR